MKEISLHILDLVENSIKANATKITIEVVESISDNIYSIRIKDDGCGMTQEFLANIDDPYTTTSQSRKIGLGIPLVKMNAEKAGGKFCIQSVLGGGTEVYFDFEHNHWDRPPLGDIAGVVVMLAVCNDDKQITYTHITDGGKYVFDTNEVRETLDGISLNNYSIITYLKDMINENLVAIHFVQ